MYARDEALGLNKDFAGTCFDGPDIKREHKLYPILINRTFELTGTINYYTKELMRDTEPITRFTSHFQRSELSFLVTLYTQRLTSLIICGKGLISIKTAGTKISFVVICKSFVCYQLVGLRHLLIFWLTRTHDKTKSSPVKG